MKQFIGIQIYMSIIALPAYFMYLPEKRRYAPISDVMSINRYKKLRQVIHATDKLSKDNKNKNNRLHKTALPITHVRKNCFNLAPECDNSMSK